MLVTIRNLAGYLLICVLNSGRTIHLGPAEILEPLDQSEIYGNDKIDKLVRARLISIAPADVAGAEGSQAGSTHGSTAEPAEPRSTGARLEGQPRRPQADPTAYSVGAAVTKAILSRFQFLIFTFLIAGLFLLPSIRAGTFVDIPTNVLGMLGVSAGSHLVAQAVKYAGPIVAVEQSCEGMNMAQGGKSGSYHHKSSKLSADLHAEQRPDNPSRAI